MKITGDGVLASGFHHQPPLLSLLYGAMFAFLCFVPWVCSLGLSMTFSPYPHLPPLILVIHSWSYPGLSPLQLVVYWGGGLGHGNEGEGAGEGCVIEVTGGSGGARTSQDFLRSSRNTS